MANKQIEISAKIALDTKQAISDIQKAGKAFNQAFAKSGQTKFFDEFKKMSPVIKEIDKQFNTLLKGMARTDAVKELANMNKALKDQTEHIKNNIARYRDLEEQIGRTSNAQDRANLRKEQRAVNEDSRRSMGKMEGLEERKQSAQETLGKGPIDYMKLAGYVAAASRIAGGMLQFAGGQNFRKMGYEAQSTAMDNRYLGDVTGGLGFGFMKASGKFDKAMKGAIQQTTTELVTEAGQTAADIATGALAGAAAGGTALSTAAGAAIGAASHVNLQNADLAASLLPGGDPVAMKAALAKNQQIAYSNAATSTEFITQLATERQGGARSRMAAWEAQGSAGWGNISAGRRKGFDEGQINAAMGIMGQSGALGAERSNASPLFGFERQGLATMGESGNMLAGTVGVMQNQQKTVSAFEKAMERGSKKGIETSLVKDLVGATIEIANATGQRVSDLSGFQRMMETALGGKRPEEIGRPDIKEARTAVSEALEMQGGANNAVGIAMQMQARTSFLKNAKIKDVDEAALQSLAQAGTWSQLSDAQKQLLQKKYYEQNPKGEAFDITEGGAQAQKYDLGAMAAAMGLRSAGRGGIMGTLATTEGLTNFRERFASGYTEKDAGTEEEMADLADEFQRTGMNRSTAEKAARLSAGMTMSDEEAKDARNAISGAKDVTESTTDRALAQIDSSQKAVRDALLSQASANGILGKALDATYKAMQDLLKPENPFLKVVNGETSLNLSMNSLEAAVDAMRDAYLGQTTGTTSKELRKIKESERADDERHGQWIRETWANQNNDNGATLPIPVEPLAKPAPAKPLKGKKQK